MAEPTSVLTFKDLIIEVSRKMGTAFYGSDGDEEVQVPTNAHDLAEAKRMVNNGIRMFLSDAPPKGWFWTRPVQSFVLWADIAVGTDTVTGSAYDPGSNKSTITATASAFFPTMEEHTLTTTTSGDFTITDYVSATVIKVQGDASAVSAETFSMASGGAFTLPVTFGGSVQGDIRFAAGTNNGSVIAWGSESEIRAFREDSTSTGTPNIAAVRPKATVVGSRRRWDLVVWSTPDADVTVEFPFDLHFDKLVEFDEVQPAPLMYDEAVKAACLAAVDKDGENVMGTDWEYYTRRALPQSHLINNRAAPKSVGSFNMGSVSRADAIRLFRNNSTRQDVSFNP
jgi:hypothetical protein